MEKFELLHGEGLSYSPYKNKWFASVTTGFPTFSKSYEWFHSAEEAKEFIREERLRLGVMNLNMKRVLNF